MEEQINDLNLAQENISHLVGQQTHIVQSQLEESHEFKQAQDAHQTQLQHELQISVQHFNDISNAVYEISYTQNFSKVLHAIDMSLDEYLRSANQILENVHSARRSKLYLLLLTPEQLAHEP